MADDRTLPFPQRAYKNYRSEMEDLAAIEERLQTVDQEDIEEYREPLAVTERKEVTIELSTGGPADGYKLYFLPSGELVEGYYYFADWFEYEKTKLEDEELARVLRVYGFYF